MRKEDLVLCGLPTVRARFERNALSIERLFFDYETGRKIGAMCKALAQARRIYRCVEPAELEKISGTMHHGGIVAVVKAPPLRAPTSDDVAAWASKRVPVLVLDRIGNAHNLGAIVRTAAFFGVPHLVIPADPAAARPNDAAYRVAEGGFEALEVWRVADLIALLRGLSRVGYETVGAAARGGRLAEGASHRPERGRQSAEVGGRRPGDGGPKPVALVLGNEERGLSPEVEQACTRLVTLPGSGRIESLNVSAAAAVLMWELMARKNPR